MKWVANGEYALATILFLLVIFVWLMPLGYLASGLLGMVGAKLLDPSQGSAASVSLKRLVVHFFRYIVLLFSAAITIARHFGVAA